MKIGIIAAIEDEIKTLKNILYPYQKKKISSFKIYKGKFKEINIILIKSGIGKVCASMSTMLLINLYKPDLIINNGSSGSLHQSLHVGDIIFPKKICYYDVNLTNFGYDLGQVPCFPKNFVINSNIYNIFKKIFYKFKFNFFNGLLISGDSFVRDCSYVKKLKKLFPSAIAVEMESAAIAQVCYKFNVPFIAIKSISDFSDNSATKNFKKNISIASNKSSKAVKIVLENVINLK
ncbi:5'-methylthioadenosine/adenosylhomocysteine nucleosidase [Buchnera aphidicola (Muscaphis stroyani)]|uniref:adenosylhomocysteine nucleosidase n=1 Tax=Buchnera aphidicola (Muscaphis stroyani) TaxID=1241869 RepID=A0A4D6YEQ1_9GAMM|nr:5'-methylthioadenosine/adenosylhomocysteine nucleosidase [Buchnera aphidicola]QCI24298.1 5'-methylthioadenosine/adenosylhomocysteine nucleosidase [Buchnera aphidicola (Muscaphis stroyani)]